MSIQTASAGRVLLKFKGNWSDLGSYAPLDCTYHSGSTYVCKNNVSSSTTPDQDTTNWQILASGFDAAAVTALKNQITTGSSFAFVIGSTTYTDVESALGALKALYDGEIGTLSNLTTTDKSSLVSAINEVKSAADTASNKVGTLTNLTTTSKTDTVSAINEVKSAADSASTKVGTLSNLTTTAKTDAVSAINEVKGLADSAGSAASTASAKVGTLSNLTTTAKTDAVSAINEVNTKLSKTEVLISNSGDAYSPSKPYKVGELCIYNNVLYRCTTACSAGSWNINQSCFTQDTLTNAVNASSEYLDGTNDIVYESTGVPSSDRQYIKLNKVAKTCMLCSGGIHNNAGTWATSFTLPQGFRPKDSIYGLVLKNDSSCCGVYIGSRGEVKFHGSYGASNTLVFTVMYLID